VADETVAGRTIMGGSVILLRTVLDKIYDYYTLINKF